MTAELIHMKKTVIEEMPLDTIVENRAAILTRLLETKADLDIFNAEIIRRAAENKAIVLFTETSHITVKREKEIQHRIDVLRRLEGIIPKDIFDQALHQESPPPVWKADTLKLKWIARNCGAEAAEIVEQGMPYEEVGTPKITVTPRNTGYAETQAQAA